MHEVASDALVFFTLAQLRIARQQISLLKQLRDELKNQLKEKHDQIEQLRLFVQEWKEVDYGLFGETDQQVIETDQQDIDRFLEADRPDEKKEENNE